VQKPDIPFHHHYVVDLKFLKLAITIVVVCTWFQYSEISVCSNETPEHHIMTSSIAKSNLRVKLPQKGWLTLKLFTIIYLEIM